MKLSNAKLSNFLFVTAAIIMLLALIIDLTFYGGLKFWLWYLSIIACILVIGFPFFHQHLNGFVKQIDLALNNNFLVPSQRAPVPFWATVLATVFFSPLNVLALIVWGIITALYLSIMFLPSLHWIGKQIEKEPK